MSILAITAIIAVLVAIPWATITLLGPPLSDVGGLFNGELMSDTERIGLILRSGLTVLVWGSWAQLAVSLVLETGAAIKGTVANRAPVMPGFQTLARHLVGTAMLLTTLIQTTPDVAPIQNNTIQRSADVVVASADIIGPVSSLENLDLSGGGGSFDRLAANPQLRTEAASTYQVGEGETLWTIAEKRTGDGLHWKELRDHNIGQTVAEGVVFGAESETLKAGWTLQVPSGERWGGSVAPANPDPVGSPVTGGEHVVEEGENLWMIAAERLGAQLGRTPTDAEITPHWNALIKENKDNLRPPNDPDLIYPDQLIVLPDTHFEVEIDTHFEVEVETDSEVEVEVEVEVEPGIEVEADLDAASEVDLPEPEPNRIEQDQQAPVVQTNPSVSAAPADSEPAADTGPADAEPAATDGFGFADPLALGVGPVLLASGVGALLLRRRQFRLAHRSKGTRPADPHHSLRKLERVVDVATDLAEANWLHAALASFGARGIWPGEPVPAPVLARLGEDSLLVYLAAADDVGAPLPWTSDDGGKVWALARSSELAAIPRPSGEVPCPLFVTLADGVLVNLEGIGVLRIVDEAGYGDEVIASLVHELCSSPGAGTIDIRTTREIAGVENYPLVRHQEPAGLCAEIAGWVTQVEQRLDRADAPNVYGYRLSAGSDPISPLVVVVGADDRVAMEPVIGLAERASLPLAVIVYEPERHLARGESSRRAAGTELRLGAESARLSSFDLEVVPRRLRAGAAQGISDLLNQAESAEPVPLAPVDLGPPSPPVVDEPIAPSSVSIEPTGPTESPVAERMATPPANPAPVLAKRPEPRDVTGPRVCLLGQIEVAGASEKLTSQQQSVVAFLAATGGATRDALIEALWDGQAISESRLPNLISELRTRFGRNHLPDLEGGRYGLQGVGCDLVDFERLVGESEQAQDPAQSAELLVEALDLVSGVPFTPPARRYWTWVGNHSHHTARAEAMIADAALTCARTLADLGQSERAQQACERGLLAAPLDELLVSELTRIYVDDGRRSTARRLVETWEASISRLDCGDPSEEPRRILSS